MAQACREAGRPHRHRRHQGDGARRDRRHRPQHDRRRPDAPARARLRPLGPATASSSPARSATTAWRSSPSATIWSSQGDLRSDVAPINGLVRAALAAGGDDVVAMKDPTRGGLSSALHEMAEKSGVGILLDEAAFRSATRSARPRSCSASTRSHVANEGKAVIGVRPGRGRSRARRAARPPARPGRRHRRHLRRRAPGQRHPRHRPRAAAARRARGRAASADLLRRRRWRTSASSETAPSGS